MSLLSSLAILFFIFRIIFGSPDGDRRLRFSERRGAEDEYRTFGSRRASYDGSPSNIGDALKIPIAVIRGTSAAAQALSPQNTQAIRSIFEIPVTTLDAVGSYIDGSRTRRIATINNNNNNNNNDEKFESAGSARPSSSSDEVRRERRDKLLKLKEAEREHRRITDAERFFRLGHHSSVNIFSSLADLLLGGGNGGGHGHGHHGNGHSWKPPKRPSKPSKPGHHWVHAGSTGHHSHGNGQYQVYEDVNEGHVPTWGIFSWLQQGTRLDADDPIQNKIAPGSEFLCAREKPEFRSL